MSDDRRKQAEGIISTAITLADAPLPAGKARIPIIRSSLIEPRLNELCLELHTVLYDTNSGVRNWTSILGNILTIETGSLPEKLEKVSARLRVIDEGAIKNNQADSSLFDAFLTAIDAHVEASRAAEPVVEVSTSPAEPLPLPKPSSPFIPVRKAAIPVPPVTPRSKSPFTVINPPPEGVPNQSPADQEAARQEIVSAERAQRLKSAENVRIEPKLLPGRPQGRNLIEQLGLLTNEVPPLQEETLAAIVAKIPEAVIIPNEPGAGLVKKIAESVKPKASDPLFSGQVPSANLRSPNTNRLAWVVGSFSLVTAVAAVVWLSPKITHDKSAAKQKATQVPTAPAASEPSSAKFRDKLETANAKFIYALEPKLPEKVIEKIRQKTRDVVNSNASDQQNLFASIKAFVNALVEAGQSKDLLKEYEVPGVDNAMLERAATRLYEAAIEKTTPPKSASLEKPVSWTGNLEIAQANLENTFNFRT